MVYDSLNDKVILFGGDANDIDFGDTWMFDPELNNWTPHFPPTSPTARDSHTMVYDPTHGKVILFGGYNRSRLNDTWTYDYLTNEWSELLTEVSPPRKWGHDMVYNTKNNLAVMFGGSTYGGIIDDTWVLKFQDSSLPSDLFFRSSGDSKNNKDSFNKYLNFDIFLVVSLIIILSTAYIYLRRSKRSKNTK